MTKPTTKVNKDGFAFEDYRTCQGCSEPTTVSTCGECLNCGRVYCRLCALEDLADGYCPDCRQQAKQLGIYNE